MSDTKSRMKVALVHDFLLRMGGAERVLKVLSEMYPEAPIYTLLYDESRMSGVFPRERVITSSLQKWHRLPGRLYRFFFTSMPRAIEEFSFEGFDLVISSSHSYAHGILVPQKTKHICYCHSPLRYGWDYTHQYMEDHGYTGLAGVILQRRLQRVREWDYAASDRPDLYLANSRHVQKRISKYYRQDSDVVYPPVDIDRFSVSDRHEDYFLIVSQLSPYKRVDLAVSLFNKIGKRLIVIGTGPQEEYLRRLAGPNVEILGYRSDSEVAAYMQYCRALIFPGEEDFGIVPVEAMACGRPVLAYGVGGALETVIPGETGELFFDLSVSAMEAGLVKLLMHEHKYDPNRLRKHAEGFSRAIFEKKIRECVKSV